MPSPAHTLGARPTSAAFILYDCLQRMAGRRTNAVLQVLGDRAQILEGRKYPRPPLVFANGRWRAYYHSHPLPAGTAREHGHFHLFCAAEERHGGGAWSHVAGLAMDQEGQPLRWFASNRWVTAGRWGERDALLAAIDALQPANEGLLICRWLSAMVCFDQPRLAGMLAARDDCIFRAMKDQSLEQVLVDRTLYELADCDIDLVLSLQDQLAGRAALERCFS